MKLHHDLLAIATIFLFACERQTPDNETAEKLIKAHYRLPRIIEHTISTVDPAVAKKLLDLGLENDSLVKIMRSQTLAQTGMPWISFTEVGKAYFLPTPKEDIKYKRQNVKVAFKEFGEVKSIVMGKENNTAIVKFSLILKDSTPFSKLVTGDFSKPQILDAFFVKYDTGWELDNKKGADMWGLD